MKPKKRKRLNPPVEERDKPTEATRYRLRRDQKLRLFQKGVLQRHHMDAADEIERVWMTIEKAASASCMTYEPRLFDIPRKLHGKTPFDHMSEETFRLFRRFFQPWVREMSVRLPARRELTKLSLVYMMVVENLSPYQIERLYGLTRGRRRAGEYLKAALESYARIAGLKPPRPLPIVGGSCPVPAQATK